MAFLEDHSICQRNEIPAQEEGVEQQISLGQKFAAQQQQARLLLGIKRLKLCKLSAAAAAKAEALQQQYIEEGEEGKVANWE